MSQSFHPISAPPNHYVPLPSIHLAVPMVFGATAVALMLICRFQQHRSTFPVIGAIVFGLLAGIYGFMAGA